MNTGNYRIFDKEVAFRLKTEMCDDFIDRMPAVDDLQASMTCLEIGYRAAGYAFCPD